ncbi:MAG TPA: hypothetical protein VK166_07535 [Chitinophagaceae bacterium]|nr:hypothetical protein [Chitinophagaceae bacterium]
MTKLILCSLLMLIFQQNTDAQTVGGLLKKIKPVKKTETGSTDKSQPNDSGTQGSPGKSGNESGSTSSANPGSGGDSKASYETLYKGEANCRSSLIYNESRLNIGAGSNGYTLVVKRSCGGKDNYVVIENGKQTGSYNDKSAIPMSSDLLTGANEKDAMGSNDKNYIKESGTSKSVVVNGKNYGSYAEAKDVFVTPDNKIVFYEWMESTGTSGIAFNEKKTNLTPIDDMAEFFNHILIKSHDKNTLALLCLGTPTGAGKVTLPAILVKPDGTKKTIKVNNIDAYGDRVFSVSTTGEVCWLDTETWDLYTEGRKVGSFKKNNSVGASNLAIIVGTDLSKAVLYDHMGNLYFQDGHVENAGAVYPFFTTSNGKQYISWLKQDGEDILKGSIEIK